MDPGMLEAAQKGDIKALSDLIGKNSLILEETALEGQTPLHVACMAGHLDFVREILKLMPKFAQKVNTDGYSPLHIAAARGDIDITKELLKVDQWLCSVTGREGRIPLHYAIINGELDVMSELLSAWPESVDKTTDQEERALHLAVKNNRNDVVVKLVEHLKKYNKAPVINRKDDEGNTALHLAVSNKNFKVVKLLLDQQHMDVDVNARNESDRTPLDLGAGVRKIREILTKAGAKHRIGRSSSSAPPVVLDVESDGDALSRSQLKILNTEEESMGDKRNALLVVAALIANATYQAVLQPPSFKTKVDNSSTKGFFASYVSWMTGSLGGDLAYVAFITGNTFGLLVSLQMIICLTRNLPLKLPLLLCVAAKVQSYCCYTYYLPFKLLDKEFSLKNVELLSVLPLIISVILLLMQPSLVQLLDLCVEWLFKCDLLGGMYSMEDPIHHR